MSLNIYNYSIYLNSNLSVEGDVWYFVEDAPLRYLKDNMHAVCQEISENSKYVNFPWHKDFEYGNPDSVPKDSPVSYEECKASFELLRDTLEDKFTCSPESAEFDLEIFISKKEIEVNYY